MRRSIVVSAPRCRGAEPGPGRCARSLAGSRSDALQPLPSSWLLDFRVIFSFRAIATVARVGSPAPGHVASVFLQAGNTRLVLDDAGGQVGLLRLEFGPQCRQLRLERGLEPRERPLATVELLFLDQRRGVLVGLPAQARGSGEDADGARVDVDQLDVTIGTTAELGVRLVALRRKDMQHKRSIGSGLQPWDDSGLLEFQAGRPSAFVLEMHLSRMHRAIDRFSPSVVELEEAAINP